ncbi:unnamed protein product [Parnassius apollo]|uniref:(apollo) hypothetical protein n=1 Tax=Parnassius apollo TaxID=110799 RepID=A0A8S3WBH1_PARAO|nr:unnamed protein product [Parnassius apollo]
MYKNQYCTDPRTMKKHAAYTEWADAYSCTRHRCQPGGRNLAIYTVGCKRVEPPESAIECEEVVEDTNMQFPYCCTRLRCLVVVRGEVWTRVLGQPWETLPAAPWSHMYKMKKPPPTDSSFIPKIGEGPIYELAAESDDSGKKVFRASNRVTTVNPDCKDVVPRANQAPDILIALNKNEIESKKTSELIRKKRVRKTNSPSFPRQNVDEEVQEIHNDAEFEETPTTEKPPDGSDEKYFANAFGVTPKILSKAGKSHQITWTQIPASQWNEHDPSMDAEAPREPNIYHQNEFQTDGEKKEEKPSNLQALVDAIGSRMRDIENVVQKMSKKVKHAKPDQSEFGSSAASIEKRSDGERRSHNHLIIEPKERENEIIVSKPKYSSPDDENHKRGSKRQRATTEATSEQPLFVDDSNINGYFSDVSNSVLRRADEPKEPVATYMAPVDTQPKTPAHTLIENSEEEEKTKKKKRMHKKKKDCTDPRTMMKHAAYTEWADAYSCTRHRCQPAGRNFAVYTVGCKRVEPPESAIECEEVVEDTNMQFPHCCTRLRCLVVERGEVWTRVIGQPWETLPATPWSHMYKMKKPPPTTRNSSFLTKIGEGPIYELAAESDDSGKKVFRASNKVTTVNSDCKDVVPRAYQASDIVIALSTDKHEKQSKRKLERIRKKPLRKANSPSFPRADVEEEVQEIRNDAEFEEPLTYTEKEPNVRHQNEFQLDVEKKEENPSNIQELFDAIGRKMRHIENVVQSIIKKIQHAKPEKPEFGSSVASIEKRGSKRQRGTTEATSEQPLFVDDSNINGYLSDVTNTILRRADEPKEPDATYMPLVETQPKTPVHTIVENSEEEEKTKKKKRMHKKKKGHKKHHGKLENKKNQWR